MGKPILELVPKPGEDWQVVVARACAAGWRVEALDYPTKQPDHQLQAAVDEMIARFCNYLHISRAHLAQRAFELTLRGGAAVAELELDREGRMPVALHLLDQSKARIERRGGRLWQGTTDLTRPMIFFSSVYEAGDPPAPAPMPKEVFKGRYWRAEVDKLQETVAEMFSRLLSTGFQAQGIVPLVAVEFDQVTSNPLDDEETGPEGATAPEETSEAGRPRKESNTWAIEEIRKGRIESEVFEEWISRDNNRELADPLDSFRKAIRAAKK